MVRGPSLAIRPEPPSDSGSSQDDQASRSMSPDPNATFHQVPAQAPRRTHPPPPPKDPSEGSWNHIHYVPCWTDPDWKDEGKEREGAGWKIKDNIMDRIRPALLAQDQAQNPTKYAERFGIFPGRSDGRSRTSPTRSEARVLWPGGLGNPPVRTGKDLFDRLEGLAQQSNLHLDDYLKDQRPDLKTVDDVDQAYMQAYENLQIDEYWQANLFGDMTMDEMHADGVFTMEDSKCDLSGPLYPLFERHRWLDTTCFGGTAEEARIVYNIDGERAEYDPRTNDKLWVALQPALQLATRLMQADEPFIAGLQDISNRSEIDSSLDQRDVYTMQKKPKHKFKRAPNKFDPTLLTFAEELRRYKCSFPEESFKVLDKLLRLRIHGAHYSEGHFYRRPTLGWANSVYPLNEDDEIHVGIAAELIWPLLVGRFSNSEKMMASFVIATTLVHEMMHAWSFAHYKWLNNPGEFSVVDSALVDACLNLHHELCPRDDMGNSEPHFEDDAYNEVGHAYESHVLGGGTWPLNLDDSNPFPLFVGLYPGIINQYKWPDGQTNNIPALAEPLSRVDKYYCFLRVGDVQKYFLQDFWQTAVQRYGMAAMRAPPERPSKVWYTADMESFNDDSFLDCNLADQRERQWIVNFLAELRIAGLTTLRHYVRSIVAELCQFDLMIKRFEMDKKPWLEQEKQWDALIPGIMLVLLEFSTAVTMASKELIQGEKDFRARLNHERWQKITLNDGLKHADEKSNSLAYALDSVSWSAAVQDSTESYENRLVPKLIQLTHLLEIERRSQESMVCELYDLAPHFWKMYETKHDDHKHSWLMRNLKLSNILREIQDVMKKVGTHMPAWTNCWQGQIQSLYTGFDNIITLICQEDNTVLPNWRSLLVTLPTMRKSRRKSRERWFFLAKKEMLRLRGSGLKKLREFKHRFWEILDLEHKIVLPEMNMDEQALAERIDGLLDDLGEQSSASRSKGIFHHNFIADMARQTGLNVAQAQQALKAQMKQGSLQQLAQQQAAQAPSIPPQITLPTVQSHPVPFAIRDQPQFGQPNLPSTPTQPFSQQQAGSNPFASYTSNSGSFPATGPNQPPAWLTSGTPKLPGQSNASFGNAPQQAAPAFGLMRHPYAIRSTVTKDLQNFAAANAGQSGLQQPAVFPQSLRMGESTMEGPGGRLGQGQLGDMDKMWEIGNQSPPPPEQQGGQALLVKALAGDDMDVSSDEESDSDLVEAQIIRESSESTAPTSPSLSGYESEVDTGARLEAERKKGKGKRRRVDWATRENKRRKCA